MLHAGARSRTLSLNLTIAFEGKRFRQCQTGNGGKKLDVRILRMRCLRFLSFQRNMDVTLCIEANDLRTRPGQHLRWEPTRTQHLPGLAVCWERGRVGSLWGAYCPPFSRRAGKGRAKACRGRAVVLGGGEAGRASRGSSL